MIHPLGLILKWLMGGGTPATSETGAWRVEMAELYVPGATRAECHTNGTITGEIHMAGAVMGDITPGRG